MTGPEQHANTVAFKQWALAEDRPFAEWVITRKDARELVALAERADTLERERDEAQRGLLLVHQMACYGPGDDTSLQETLGTIAAFVAKRLGL